MELMSAKFFTTRDTNHNNLHLEETGYTKSHVIDGVTNIATFALFVIGCVGAAGAFPGPKLGWTTLGMASAIYAIHLSGRDMDKAQIAFKGLIATTLVALGIWGGLHHLSGKQVGWGIVVTLLVRWMFLNRDNYMRYKAQENLVQGQATRY